MKCRLWLLLCTGLWCATFLLIEVRGGAAEKNEPVSEEKAQAYMEATFALQAAIKVKDYAKIILLSRKQLEVLPGRFEPYYNTACAFARLGRLEEAFASLTKSIEFGYADPKQMAEDEDLVGLREDQRFKELKRRATETQHKAENRSLDKRFVSFNQDAAAGKDARSPMLGQKSATAWIEYARQLPGRLEFLRAVEAEETIAVPVVRQFLENTDPHIHIIDTM